MSTLTYILLLAALVLLTLLVVNAIFYRRRFGTFLRPEKRPSRRQPLSHTELWLSAIMVLGLLAGVAGPTLAPSGSFAQWLAEPYSQLAYYAWCLLAPIVVQSVILILAFIRARRKQSR